MNKKLHFKSLILLVALLLGGVGSAWAADETIVFSKLNLENGVQYSEPFDGGNFTVTFAGGGNDGKYYSTGSAIRVYGGGTMTVAAKSTSKLAKIEIVFDGTNKPTTSDVVDGGTYNPENGTWTGSASSVVFTRPTGSGHWRINSIAVTYDNSGTLPPIINAENVSVAYNAKSGTISSTISNPVSGGVLSAAITAGNEEDWLTLGTISGSIPFTCKANEAKTERTATVILTYTYNTDKTVTKTVLVTQEGNSTVIENISDITAEGTYNVKGTIVAKSARGFIVGDGTGYVYYYNQSYTQADYNIGDKVMLSGSVSAYGGVLEFTNSTTVTAATESNYEEEEPTALTGADMDTRVASTTPAQLSNYVQYEGKLTVSDSYYNITNINGASTAIGSISFPINTDFASLANKTVKVTGYYVGISSSKYYNTIISSVEEVKDPVITVAETEVEVTAEGEEGTIDLTYTNIEIDDMQDFGIQFYSEDGSESNNPDWIEVLIAEQDPQIGQGYVVSYVVENNTGDARTACFKVYSTGTKGSVYSNLVTVNQAAYVVPVEAGVGAFVKVTSTADITTGRYLIVYEGNADHDAMVFNGSLETLDAANNGIAVGIIDGKIPATNSMVNATFTLLASGSVKSASGWYIGVSSNSNGLKTTNIATTYTNSFSIDDNENAVIKASFDGSTMTLRYNYASGQLRFRYYSNGQQAIALYKYDATATVPTITVEVPANYYTTTFASPYAVDFDGTGATVCIAKVENGAAKLAAVRGNIAPANTGVILYAEAAGNYVGTITEGDPTGAPVGVDGNDMVGVTTETAVPWTSGSKYNYILQGGVFKKANGAKLHAGKAYLSTDYQATSRELQIVFEGEDEATGIADVKGQKEEGGFFNLSGQRVTKPTKGLYINNGKKMIVK